MPQHCQDEGDAERVEVGGQAWVGVVGHGDNTVNMITPRRATTLAGDRGISAAVGVGLPSPP